MKVNLSKTLALVLFIMLFGSMYTFGQELNKPEPAANTNIGATSPWSAACASNTFNEFFVNFTWNPPLVGSDNEFILELSDASGNFDTTTELDRMDDKNTTFDFDFRFELTEEIQGDAYRFRVRSTSPAAISPESDAFSMYFISFSSPILISRDGDGIIPTGGIIQNCDGDNVILEAHNVPNAENFNYNWFRSGTLLSEKSSSITVSQDGMYFVEIDYGPNCSGSANTLSNAIEIQEGASSGIAITEPATTTLCAGQTVDLIANINDATYTYTWFLNGTAVTTPTLGESTFTVDSSTANFDGDYTLQLEGSGICTEMTDAITITNAGNFTVTLGNDTNIVLLPSQPRTLSVATTATTPTYQWFRNNSPITGATNTTLEISTVGEYFVRVTETGGPCAGTINDSENITTVLPDGFELVVDFSGEYTSCESTSAILSITQINAIASDGSRINVTTDLSGDFTYQWTRNGTAVTGETNNTISLASSSENGDYQLEGSLGSFNQTSNNINVTLAGSETVSISSTDLALCDGVNSITITSDFDSLASETFTWLRNGTSISTTDVALNITQTGAYQLQIDRTGCPILSNVITIVEFDESIVTVDSDENIIIVEGGSETITASGATTYEWVDENNTLLSSTDSVTLNLEGTYLLTASVGSCQITRTFTVAFRDNFAIPNVITANGDGVNDLWVLPNTFSGDPNTTIIIFNENGEEIVNQTNYQNNWPESSTPFTQSNTIFYYSIRRDGRTLNQGTITVIR